MTTINRDNDANLLINGVKVATLAKKYGTPLYVYSHDRLLENYRAISENFAEIDPLIAFSMKSNSNGAVLRTLIQEGSGLDIVSGGELDRGLRAGVDPQKVIYAGVGKTRDELTRALKAGIKAFNVESIPEAEAIAEVAAKLRKKAPICLRVNPDVDASTHAYITTGRKENKFGIPFYAIRKLMRKLAKNEGLDLVGLHCHIGSQILKPDGYIKALDRMAELIGQLRKDGHPIRVLNLGGGFGISYSDDEQAMDMKALAKALLPKIKALDVDIIFEPGRSVAGPAGFLITEIQYVKTGDAKNFAIVDGAMNDLLRPSLYSAYHRILLDGKGRRGRKRQYDVVGPICESGDFLGKDRSFGSLAEGDRLVVCEAGAYGMAMASNYNSRPRPAEVMVKGRRHCIVRQRETMDEVIGREEIPAFLDK